MISSRGMITERGRLRMEGKFYIAYGSNLSIAQMKYRTPDAEIVGTAVLRGWRLLFRQYATITRSAKFDTPVLIWKISKQDEKNLDRYEGYPKFYVKENLKVAVTSLDGEDLGEMTAMVYIMTSEAVKIRKNHAFPSSQYFSILQEGYAAFGFDEKILTQARREAFHLTFKPESQVIRRASQPTTA